MIKFKFHALSNSKVKCALSVQFFHPKFTEFLVQVHCKKAKRRKKREKSAVKLHKEIKTEN